MSSTRESPSCPLGRNTGTLKPWRSDGMATTRKCAQYMSECRTGASMPFLGLLMKPGFLIAPNRATCSLSRGKR